MVDGHRGVVEKIHAMSAYYKHNPESVRPLGSPLFKSDELDEFDQNYDPSASYNKTVNENIDMFLE